MRRCRVHVAQLQQPDSCRLYSSHQDGENGESETAEPKFLNIYGAQESIPPAYLVRQAGTSNRVVVPASQAGNRFLGSLKGLQIRTLHTILFFVIYV
jgi:hypothetical protein